MHKAHLVTQLSALFGCHGRVLRVQFPPSGSTRQAFVQMDSVHAAVEALILTHGTHIAAAAHDACDSRSIAVSFTATKLRL